MKFLKFSKPKNPGFGLDTNYYMSVLSGQAVLPPISTIAHPKGEAGAVPAFGVPLNAGAGKHDLGRAMERGQYALASLDRKTVLRLRVLSREEAGFDPAYIVRSALADTLPAETLVRLKSTWHVLQLSVESHDAAVYPALDLILDICARLGERTEGVIADPMAQRYLLPSELRRVPRADPRVDAREHVAVRFEASREGYHAYTLGLQKFGMPEFEVYRLESTDGPVSEAFLTGLAQSALLGAPAAAGTRVGAVSEPLEVRAGGLDRGKWEGIPCLELLPATGKSPSAALAAWKAEL